MTRPKRKIILNKSFQVKYALMIGGAMALLLVISMFFTCSAIKTLLPNILSSHFGDNLRAIQTELAVGGFVYVALIAYLSFHVSHKIAGPIFRIEKDIKHVIETNDLNFRFKLREKDELQELAVLLNELMDCVKRKK